MFVYLFCVWIENNDCSCVCSCVYVNVCICSVCKTYSELRFFFFSAVQVYVSGKSVCDANKRLPGTINGCEHDPCGV